MKPKIHLLEVLDLISNGSWAEWACEYSLDGQTWQNGSVQSDGNEIAYETLSDENGNPVTSTDQ